MKLKLYELTLINLISAIWSVLSTHTFSQLDVYFVTAFVPSETACFANSPGSRSRTAVWISLDESVCFLLYLTSLDASPLIFSNRSLMNEFIMDMLRLEIPVSG